MESLEFWIIFCVQECTYKINLGGPRLAPWRVVVGKMGSVFSQLMWSPAGYAQAYVYTVYVYVRVICGI